MSKIMVLADSIVGEGSLPGLLMAVFSLYPQEMYREGQLSLSYRATNPIMGAPPSWSNYLPKGCTPKYPDIS